MNLYSGDRVGHVQDVDPEEMEYLAVEKEYVNTMRYIQESLDRELGDRTRK